MRTRLHPVCVRRCFSILSCETEVCERESGRGTGSATCPVMTRAGVCNKRLLGEIALQLDTRILQYIFAPQRSSSSHQPHHHYHHDDITPATGVLRGCHVWSSVRHVIFICLHRLIINDCLHVCLSVCLSVSKVCCRQNCRYYKRLSKAPSSFT